MRSFAVQPNGRSPLTVTRHRLRRGLDQGLGGEHVLDLRRPDAEGEGAERAVGRGVAVSAHDGRAGEGEALLGSDDVDDPVARIVGLEQVDPELLAVADQGVDLELRVLADAFAAVGGDVVVDDRDGGVGAAYLATGLPQPFVWLRRRYLVGEVAVDVEQTGAVVLGRDDVAVPDFLEQGSWLRHPCAPGTAAGLSCLLVRSVAAVPAHTRRLTPWRYHRAPGIIDAVGGVVTAWDVTRPRPARRPARRQAESRYGPRGVPRIGECVFRSPRTPFLRYGCAPRSRARRRISCRPRSCRSGPRW